MYTKLQEWLEKKFILVSGKGGVGKSLVSILIAREAAKKGKKVLLCEISPFDKLAPLFGLEDIRHNEKEVLPNIWSINLNAKKCFEDYVCLHMDRPKLYQNILSANKIESLLQALPGLDEIMLLGKIYYTCERSKSSNYDLVILDAPATGHFYNLMTTPESVIKSGIVGPLIKEIKKITKFLYDPLKSGVILVSTPEPLIMSETVEFLDLFFRSKIKVELLGLIMNRCYPKLLSPSNSSPTIDQYLIKKANNYNSALKILSEKKIPKFKVLSLPDHEIINEPVSDQLLEKLFPSFKKLELSCDLNI